MILNFVALDNCTCHALFAINMSKHTVGYRQISDRNKFPCSFIQHRIVADTKHIGGGCHAYMHGGNILSMVHACTLAATLPDDIFLLWQIFVGV